MSVVVIVSAVMFLGAVVISRMTVIRCGEIDGFRSGIYSIDMERWGYVF